MVETMKYILTDLYNTHVFEIVEKMPKSFFVWNIGDNMQSDELIPICEWSKPYDPEDYNINANTLKAIRLDPAEVKQLRDAAHWGIGNLDKAEKALASKSRSKEAARKKKLAADTIEIYRRIAE